jgi:hypothetical protein
MSHPSSPTSTTSPTSTDLLNSDKCEACREFYPNPGLGPLCSLCHLHLKEPERAHKEKMQREAEQKLYTESFALSETTIQKTIQAIEESTCVNHIFSLLLEACLGQTEDLFCCVCLQVSFEVTPCGHCLCKGCATKILAGKKPAANAAVSDAIPCPLCQKELEHLVDRTYERTETMKKFDSSLLVSTMLACVDNVPMPPKEVWRWPHVFGPFIFECWKIKQGTLPQTMNHLRCYYGNFSEPLSLKRERELCGQHITQARSHIKCFCDSCL